MAIGVTDSGSGIDEADLTKIFQPFFSAKKGKGIGLGLSICDRIIQNHGGKITVESTPGKGTTFAVHLPLQYTSRANVPESNNLEERAAAEALETYLAKP